MFRRAHRWELADAAERHRLYPDTFEIPDDETLRALAPGDLVKLIFEPRRGTTERMWVIVRTVGPDQLTGTLDNEPYGIRGLHAGDTVVFETRHVCQVPGED